MNQTPEVSVILSTYSRNHGDEYCANYLKRALDSIVNQTFSNFELILIDDGSTDGSEEVAKKYAEEDPRICYVRFDHNSGLPAQRYNQGIGLSKGKFIAFMFDDDEWVPDALENLHRALSHLPPIYGMVNGSVQYHCIQDGINNIIHEEFGLEASSFRKMFLTNKLANNSVLIRREVFDLVGGYDETLCMRRVCDWDLWIRIGMRYKIQVVPKIVARVYQGLTDSLLNSFKLNQHLVYARQLLFFRKQPLRKHRFRMNVPQWRHFLKVLVFMPFYVMLRYTNLVLSKSWNIRRFLPKKLVKILKPIVRSIKRSI